MSLFWRAGVFGPSQSGKTTVVQRLVLECYQKYRMPALILDPHTDEWHLWPKVAVGYITANEQQFWRVVWESKGCVVVVEEASTTIARNPDLIGLFTKLRHRLHRLIVVGHSGMDLLPVMREQLTDLYLFRQSAKAAKIWAETMTEPKLSEAVSLQQYEFLRHKMFGKPVKMILSKDVLNVSPK